MDETEFDKFATEYESLMRSTMRVSGEGVDFFARYKVLDAAQVLATDTRIESRIRVLDFGAGVGASTPHFQQAFPDATVVCADVSMRSLKVGHARFANASQFVCFDGTTLPFVDNSFDLVFAACVFHHIPGAQHVALMREFARIVAPQGRVMIFEHNPLNPITRRIVADCPFDENAVLIAARELRERMHMAGYQCDVAFRLFFPNFLRRLRFLERWLRWLPLGAQYYVSACKPDAAAPELHRH
jgi:ubiquinone/menaquinone biosynthesis C-methylase UbiE